MQTSSLSTGTAATTTTAAKAPNVEVYGFVLYLLSFVGLGVFLVWAYVPDATLHQLGFTYFPSKYWAVSIPVYGLMMPAFIVVFFVAWSWIQTPPLSSISTITDQHATVVDNLGTQQSSKNAEKIPELLDIPIGVVNNCMFRVHSGALDQAHN